LIVLVAVCGASAPPHLCSFTLTQMARPHHNRMAYILCRATWMRRGSCSQRCRRPRGCCCCPRSRPGCTWTRCSAPTSTPSRPRCAAAASLHCGTSWSSSGGCCVAHTRHSAPAVTPSAPALRRGGCLPLRRRMVVAWHHRAPSARACTGRRACWRAALAAAGATAGVASRVGHMRLGHAAASLREASVVRVLQRGNCCCSSCSACGSCHSAPLAHVHCT